MKTTEQNQTQNIEIQDQAARRQALDPGRSFIVQAPAGSGKTGLLTQRFLVLLATVDEPEEIIAITFTRKAAGEMKQRILQALHTAANIGVPPAHDTYQRQLYALARRVLERDTQRGWQLLNNPSRLRIRTIDALCAWLVERMPVASRQGALLAVTEDADKLYLEAARMTVDMLETDSVWSTAIEHLVQHLDNQLDRLQQLIADMLARRDLWLPQVVHRVNTDDTRAYLEAILAGRIEKVLKELAGSAPVNCQTEIIQLMQFAASNLFEDEMIEDWPSDALSDRASWESIADFLLTKSGEWRKSVTKNHGFPAPSSAQDADEKIRLGAMKQRMSDLLHALQDEEIFHQNLLVLRELPPRRYSDAGWETLQALFDLLKVAVGQLVLVFQQHGQVDFTEITIATLRALGEPETPSELALMLDYRISHVLVDEFQDTSASQAELLQRITAGWQDGDGRTLFLVGDPMQSIYRFRQAEVGLFLDIRDRGRFGQISVEFLRLSVNFRSQRGIIDWINCYFSKILPANDDVSTGAVAYARSTAFHSLSESEAVKVYPYLQRDDRQEAEQVVAIIQQTKTTWPDGSIAVLVRNRSHLMDIVVCLKQKKIPFQAVEIEPLAQRMVIRDLMTLTRALVHPADRIAWLALLRAPFCGFSLADLYVIVNASPGQPLIDGLRVCTESVTLSTAGMQRLVRVLPILERALALYDRMALRSCVEGTWLELGGPAVVREATDLADADVFFQALEKLDFRGQRPDIQELDEQLIRLFASPDVSTDDAPQLMTLHKAKGLEFDTVILPGLGKSPRRDQEKLLNWLEFRDQTQGFSLLCAPISAPGEDKNRISAYILSVEKKRAALEEARLLYVAATRAKHSLHLLGHITMSEKAQKNGELKPSADTLLAKLWPAVAANFRVKADETMEEEIVESNADTRPLFTVNKRCLTSDWQLPAPPAAITAMSTNEHRVTEEMVDFDWVGEPARLVGIVVHRLLQYIGQIGVENITDPNLQNLEQTGRVLLIQQGIAAEHLEMAVQQVMRALRVMCIEDETGRWILSNQHREAHCEWTLSTVKESSVVVNVIDRTFIDINDVRWVIDYKTGTHTGGGIEVFLDQEQQRYRSQLERYAKVIQQMEQRVIHLMLYFPLLGKFRKWTPSESI